MLVHSETWPGTSWICLWHAKIINISWTDWRHVSQWFWDQKVNIWMYAWWWLSILLDLQLHCICIVCIIKNTVVYTIANYITRKSHIWGIEHWHPHPHTHTHTYCFIDVFIMRWHLNFFAFALPLYCIISYLFHVYLYIYLWLYLCLICLHPHHTYP